eukprot:4997773-Pyramimonas_sp.AAC.1
MDRQSAMMGPGSTDCGRPAAKNRQTLVSVVCGRQSPASAVLRSADQHPAMDHRGRESRRHGRSLLPTAVPLTIHTW